MTPRMSQRRTAAPRERAVIDHLVKHVNVYRRDVVVNYYVALKARRFVILAGPRDVDKMRLAQGLAEVLVGQSSMQWCLLQAHPWWTTRTGAPGYFAMAHTRFNTLKLLDFIGAASASQAMGLSFPFFIGVERMSPAEIVCYFQDMPRGLLWRADGSTVQIDIPQNLSVTGTLNVEEKDRLLLSQEVYRYATVIHLDRIHFARCGERSKTWRWRPDWQRRFANSAVRRGDRARARLARILPDNCVPLAPLHELERRFEAVDCSPFLLEQAWLYLANAFDVDGRGLFVESIDENLRIAQDYVLVQSVLPYVSVRWTGAPPGAWREVSKYLAPRFPRAHAWIAGLPAWADLGARRSPAMIPVVETSVRTDDGRR